MTADVRRRPHTIEEPGDLTGEAVGPQPQFERRSSRQQLGVRQVSDERGCVTERMNEVRAVGQDQRRDLQRLALFHCRCDRPEQNAVQHGGEARWVNRGCMDEAVERTESTLRYTSSDTAEQPNGQARVMQRKQEWDEG